MNCDAERSTKNSNPTNSAAPCCISNQHRGYLSNRKTDKATDNETKGILAEMGELAADDEAGRLPDAGQLLCKTR